MSTTTSYASGTTDILDEPIDSSSVLIARLDAWRHAISVVHAYANSVLHSQNSLTADLAKRQKIVSDVPKFNGASVAGSAASSTPSSPSSARPGQVASAGTTSDAGSSAVAAAFQALVKQTRAQLQESEHAAASIKSSIIPQLELVDNDLQKHHKTLRAESHKLTKDAEKYRENTTKHLESLGRAVPSAQRGGPKLEPKSDPYVLHRQVRRSAMEQINKENQLSESNLNVQNNFGSLEQHVIEVLQGAVSSLNELAQRSSQVDAQASANTQQYFAAIQPTQEWALFKNANARLLVPDAGYARDPNKVTFANATAEPTVPIIEGFLDRKGTVLKGHKPGYYVLTPSGFLHQFKSADFTVDTHPELSLYIPEAEISGLPTRTSGDLSFRIVSRDANKPVSPHHKYTFTAASYEELVAWHTALARVAGATASANTLESTEEDPGIIPSPDGSTGYGSPTTATPSEFTNAPGAAAGVPDAGASRQAPLGGLQREAVPPQQQQLQSGLGQTAGQGTATGGILQQPGSGLAHGGQARPDLSQGVNNLNLGPQSAQSGLNRDVNQFASAPQQAQSGLRNDVNQFAGAPQQAQAGLNRDVNQFASAPQQVQSGLRNDVNQFASAPQQVQSGLRNDVNQFASAPQHVESGFRDDAKQFTSAPQQLQSGFKNDVDQFAKGPQQLRSDVSGDVNELKNGPQQFQSGLKDDVNQFTRPFK